MSKMDYRKLYQDIMNLDPKIRLVTICDINGRVMYSEHREGVRNLLTPGESNQAAAPHAQTLSPADAVVADDLFGQAGFSAR